MDFNEPLALFMELLQLLLLLTQLLFIELLPVSNIVLMQYKSVTVKTHRQEVNIQNTVKIMFLDICTNCQTVFSDLLYTVPGLAGKSEFSGILFRYGS